MEPRIIADSSGTYSVAVGEWLLVVSATLDQARAIVRDIRVVRHTERKVDHAEA